MNLSALINEYQSLLEAGKNFELIDKFYADNISQVENNAAPVHGKITLREIEKNNIEGVYSFSQQIVSLVINEDMGLVMGEMQVKFHSKKSGKKIIHEAFIQKWKDAKIYYQRFYYRGIENDEN